MLSVTIDTQIKEKMLIVRGKFKELIFGKKTSNCGYWLARQTEGWKIGWVDIGLFYSKAKAGTCP